MSERNNNPKSDKKLNQNLDNFLNEQPQIECDSNGVCHIKQDKSLVERLNKKIITEDGRELLL